MIKNAILCNYNSYYINRCEKDYQWIKNSNIKTYNCI